MLDAIIDLRTPRFLMIVRNAFGGAYAAFNNYPTGADFVCALPTTRLAVMGPAGVEYVYKDEVRKIRSSVKPKIAELTAQNLKAGMPESEALKTAKDAVAAWQKQEELLLTQRYERELMNPNEALSLGSISQIVMPSDLRKVLGEQLELHLKAYKPEPMSGMQREFH